MTELQVFNNVEFGSVRTTTINGEVFFVGKDVAEILGYQNASKALQDHVDADDKLNNESLLSLGQRGGWFINESGLYSLILSSKMPKAKAFKRWVTSEVLPSIRKHGLYAMNDILENPDALINALLAYKEEKAKAKELTMLVAVKDQQLAELQPKASYYDLVLSCEDAIPITVIAEDYGWSAQRMNAYLCEAHIQRKLHGTWILYKEYADKGYTNTKTHTYTDNNGVERSKIHTYWTQKGRLFIYDLLRAEGIYPTIETEEEG